MAPMPDDPNDHDNEYDWGQWDGFKSGGPPPGLPFPTVVTTTWLDESNNPTVNAYLVGATFPSAAAPYPTTFYTFTDFNEASAVAEEIEEASEALDQSSILPGNDYLTFIGPYLSGTPTSAQKEQQAATPLPTGANPTSAAATGAIPSFNPDARPEHHKSKTAVITASVVIPIAVVILTIVICVFCVRHYKKKARNAKEGGHGSEMKTTGSSSMAAGMLGTREERAHFAPNAQPLQSVQATSSTPLNSNSNSNAGPDAPVILSTTMNNTYFTGIDTSDRISMSDVRSMASHDTYGEEPPPPYRPRSVPPISRDTSVRTAHLDRNSSVRSQADRLSGGSLVRRSNEVRSPFDDPEEEDEDDALSETSTIRPTPDWERDRLQLEPVSPISTLSFEREPTNPRSTL